MRIIFFDNVNYLYYAHHFLFISGKAERAQNVVTFPGT